MPIQERHIIEPTVSVSTKSPSFPPYMILAINAAVKTMIKISFFILCPLSREYLLILI